MGVHRSRHIVEPEDKEEIIALYRKGFSVTEISRVTGFLDSIVRALIKDNTGKYTEIDPSSKRGKKIIQNKYGKASIPGNAKRKSSEELKNQIIDLYSKNYSIDDIITEIRDLTRTEIETILFDAGKIENDSEGHRIKRSIDMADVREFAKSIKVGDKFTVMEYFHDLKKSYTEDMTTAVVQKKYRNVVLTDKGSYSYVDLYLLKQD